MKRTPLLCLAVFTLLTHTIASAVEYTSTPEWAKPPEGQETIGNSHGDVAVSSAGEIYVSVLGGNKAGVQVYSADGKYLRNVPNAPADFHGFVIHKGADGEFIYGPRLGGQTIEKLALDGKVVLSIPASVIPDQFKKTDKNGKAFVSLTGMDVAPNGDWYVTDGYANDYVHHFDSTGKYLNSFGGRGEPYNFKTLHKIAIDTRFTPLRIIACDRANMRVVHLSLNGEFLGVVAKDLLLPAAVAIHGDLAAIGELKGRVTLLDKSGNIVAQLGANTDAAEIGNNKTEPVKWRMGIVTSPHGVAFDAAGNLYVSEYNLFGRVHRYNVVK